MKTDVRTSAMSTIGIIQIHDEINSSNGECCCICFRPGSERRLVDPKGLNSLMSKLAYVIRFQFQRKFKVCYICEALAKSAARFVRAVEVAARVSDLFSGISPEQWQDIVKHLGSTTKAEKALVQEMNKDGPPRRALRLDRELRSCPRYQLLRTDTLVVEGGAATSAPGSAPASGPTRSQPSKDLVIIMQHEELPKMLPVIQPMLPMMSTVMMPTLPQGHGLSTLPQLSIEPDHKHMRVLNKETNEYILHPMVTGLDGNVYVPTLQLQIMDNGLLKSVNDTYLKDRLPPIAPKPLNIPPNNPLSTSNLSTNNPLSASNHLSTNNPLSTSKLNSTVTKRQIDVASIIERNHEKAHYHNFLVSQMRQRKAEMQRNNVEIIKMNDFNIVLNDDCDDNTSKKKQKFELDQTLSEVEHILSENAHGACEIKYELIDDDDDNSVSSCNQVSASGNQLSTGGNHGSMTAKSATGVDRVSPSGKQVSARGNHGSMTSKSGAGGNRVSPSGNRAVAGGNRMSASGNHLSASSNSGAKEPLLRTDRTVDWEDKIPMDVISFMDATDPNPQERIMQPPPMGFISDVRSVPVSADNIECIDLC